jgi:hypothetical protein
MSFLAPPKRKRVTAADVCNWIPCPSSGGGVNRWVYGRFLKCAEEGIDPDEALAVIASRASRTVKPDELGDASARPTAEKTSAPPRFVRRIRRRA